MLTNAEFLEQLEKKISNRVEDDMICVIIYPINFFGLFEHGSIDKIIKEYEEYDDFSNNIQKLPYQFCANSCVYVCGWKNSLKNSKKYFEQFLTLIKDVPCIHMEIVTIKFS